MGKLTKSALLFLLTALSLTLAGCSGEGLVIFGVGVGIFGLIMAAALFILVVWAIIDIIQKPYPMSKKLLWAIIILIIPYIGAIIYFLFERNSQSRTF